MVEQATKRLRRIASAEAQLSADATLDRALDRMSDGVAWIARSPDLPVPPLRNYRANSTQTGT